MLNEGLQIYGRYGAISSLLAVSKVCGKRKSLPWPSAISSYWRQTFHITPFTNSWVMSWMYRDTWVEFKQDIAHNWFKTWQKYLPAQQSCFICFHLCSSASWTFFGFATVSVSEYFLSSTNTTTDGECMSYFKLALPHFWDLFCSRDPCIQALSLGQFCKNYQC